MAPKLKPAKKGDEVLSIPNTVVSRIDVALVGLLEQQSHQHHKDRDETKVSPVLQEMVESNHLDLAETVDRQRLYSFLSALKIDAPQLHMSFAAEPSVEFTGKLINWLREEIHPLLLLDIGLQPTIAAGCIIRTTNKIIDCSMRQHLLSNRDDLLRRLNGVKSEAQHA
jgi:F0F1-type ATP synthase delta subunit